MTVKQIAEQKLGCSYQKAVEIMRARLHKTVESGKFGKHVYYWPIKNGKAHKKN